MITRTLAELRNGSRRRVDAEYDGDNVSNTELNGYVNDGIAELYDVRVDADDGKLYALNAPKPTTKNGDYAFPLPSDFYRLVSIDVNLSGKPYPVTAAHMNDYHHLAANPPLRTNPYYLLRKEFGTATQELYIFPKDITVDQLRVTYLPQPPVLTLDTQTFVGTLRDMEFIELAAAIQLLHKEESETTAAEFQKEQVRKAIVNSVKDVDLAKPRLPRSHRRDYRWRRRR